MRKLLALVLCLALTYLNVSAADNHPPHVAAYIDTHYEIAIREMHRSGIPASITIAQGILESSWGQGKLSTNSNNHFGIKCKSTWTGKTYYIEDDDYENGKLMKSCFRVYNSVEDSYIDHTNFLVQNPRYAILFTYDKTDYVNWAKGLKKCGYATDKAYAQKLIDKVEQYGLHKYDYVEAVQAPVNPPVPNYETTPVETYPNIPADVVTTQSSENSIIDDFISSPNELGDDEYETETITQNTTTPIVRKQLPVRKYELEASTAYDHEVPAAVSIENYERNTGGVNSQEVETTTYNEQPSVVETETYAARSSAMTAPVYTYNKEVKVITKAELDTRISTDNDQSLFQLRAKPRVSSQIRE